MQKHSIVVRAEWDEEAQVWFASSNDINGLSVEADTQAELKEKVLAAICDLIELNGFISDLPEVPVHIMSEQLLKVTNPCH